MRIEDAEKCKLGKKPVIILGAGAAGLGAAGALALADYPFYMIEQEDGPGGLVRTDSVGDFWFDRAGHFIHSRTRRFRSEIRNSGVKLEQHRRVSAVIIEDSIVPYPVQFNLCSAPDHIAAKIRLDVDNLEKSPDYSSDFNKFLDQVWGESLSQVFFKPYLEKMWGCPLNDLPREWASRYLPARDLDLMRKGLTEPTLDYGYNSDFLYPASGRIGDLADAFAAPHADRLILNRRVVSIDKNGKSLKLCDGSTIEFQYLISTIPLNTMLEMLDWKATNNLLNYSNVLNLRIGFRGKALRPEHWYYVPDRSVPFFRAGFPSNVTSNCCPPGCSMLSLEYGMGSRESVDANLNVLAAEAVRYFSDRGILSCDGIEVVDGHLISPGYVSHRMEVTPVLQKLAGELLCDDIIVAGRYGAWDYFSLEEAYLSGHKAGRLARRKLRAGVM